MPLLPRKNVQQERTDPDDGDHQKCAGQNNVCHDNASSARSWLGSEVDARNLGFWRQSAVRLRQRECYNVSSLLTMALPPGRLVRTGGGYEGLRSVRLISPK
jgi:hypothetical protein